MDDVSLLELERKIGAIYFVDHYKMIADEFLYKRILKLPYFANCNGNRDKKYRHSVYRMVLHIWKGYLFRRK
mgnify:CR=1 FL=1